MKRLALASVWTVLCALLGAACGEDDPCDGVAGTCLTVHVDSTTVKRIDALELDVSYGTVHGTATTLKSDGATVELPLATAVLLEPGAGADPTMPVEVSVVAAGKLDGAVLGTGVAWTDVAPGAHGSLTVHLNLVERGCIPEALYCGGDRLDGQPDRLYACNASAVPTSRGLCLAGCNVRTDVDDECRAHDGPCIEGGLYCGGDKVAGDPQTLYRCDAGTPVRVKTCATVCLVKPPGEDDDCQ